MTLLSSIANPPMHAAAATSGSSSSPLAVGASISRAATLSFFQRLPSFSETAELLRASAVFFSRDRSLCICDFSLLAF